jgi:long-chain acyl-CoA synthetase
MLSHANLLWTTTRTVEALQLTDDDCYMSFLSLSYATEQIMAIYAPVMCGMVVYYAPEVATLLPNLREVQPTVIAAPPEFWVTAYEVSAFRVRDRLNVHLQALKELLPMGPANLGARVVDQVRKAVGCGRVRLALVGGGSPPAPAAVGEALETFGISLLQVYGQQETCGITTLNLPQRNKAGSVGKSLSDCQVKIANDGEILVSGSNVFIGYYKVDLYLSSLLLRCLQDDAMTAKCRPPDGWFHTGDVGSLSDDGFLVLYGRKSEVIKLSDGQTVHPLQVETALRFPPFIRYCIRGCAVI